MINVNNLTKKFANKIILDNISFFVTSGEIFGYIGPNGSGKTTTIKILLGLLKPTNGEVKVLEENPWVYSSGVKRKIGAVLENNGLYEQLSVYSNLDYYAQLYGIPKALKEIKIEEVLKLVGLQGEKSEQVTHLSKGMKQKVALARAFLHEPDLIFLDEPTVNLDVESQRHIRDFILRLTHDRGTTFFLTSQNLIEVEEICNRIAIINRGQIKEIGSIVNLKEKYNKPMAEIKLQHREKFMDIVNFIKSLPFVYDCILKDGEKLIVDLDSIDRISELNRILVEMGVNIEEVKKIHGNLEKIYLNAIGVEV